MSFLTKLLTVLVALEFFYIMYLETFATTSKSTSRVFNIPQKELHSSYLNTLFKNQGIYNGLLGVGLIYSIFSPTASLEISRIILIYIICVAIYGSVSSDKKIIFTQGGLAIITLITTFF
ncbi:DUF1304 domain-containing protein [Enterococcus sp. AZ103]|uniref:DUF1304 domain-containing protein n=1 Tax=Enterococcus sp. AZ103 TaxID=2774628 RepID=UPI003F26D0FD